MIRQGQISLIDGLFGCVDVATQEDRERFGDDEGGRGLVIYIPFSGANQADVDGSVMETGNVNREEKETMSYIELTGNKTSMEEYIDVKPGQDGGVYIFLLDRCIHIGGNEADILRKRLCELKEI